MAHHQFELLSGRKIGVSVIGEPIATRLVVLCLPTPAGGPFDPDPSLTVRESVRVIQIDRPGYGGSDPLPASETPTMERFADDIAEYLRRVRREAETMSDVEFGAAAVIGWSFGGAIATMLASRHPDLVDRVVIVAAPRPRKLRSGVRFSAIAELRKHGMEQTIESLASTLADDGEPALVNLGVDPADPALEPLGVRGRLERMLEAGWAQGSIGSASDRIAVRDRAWLDSADRVTQPSLLVYGGQDIVATAKDANWYERHIAGAKLVTDADAGHLVMLDQWADILEFVLKTK